jgi:hypothetical protein
VLDHSDMTRGSCVPVGVQALAIRHLSKQGYAVVQVLCMIMFVCLLTSVCFCGTLRLIGSEIINNYSYFSTSRLI